MAQQQSPVTVQTRFLLLSDTHDKAPAPSTSQYAFRHPLPSSDVLLHAGDLTMVGGASNYKQIVQWLSTSDAELKIVIAGNHDIDLDAEYYRRNSGEKSEVAEQHIRAARAVWESEEASEAGIVYLEEGVRTFYLRNGAKFTIYTSPYQPEFCGWAFPYTRDTDRFNPSSSANPIPAWPAIDIMLTHGPPYGILDTTIRGELVGCEHLRRAVERARPRLHVFGHIHEGYGAERLSWGTEARVDENENGVAKLDLTQDGGRGLEWGEETVCVNAAIMNVHYRPRNAPWVVDVDLPKT